MSMKKLFLSAIGIALAVAISCYVIRQIDTESLILHLKDMNYFYIVPAFLVYCTGIMLRSARWRLFYPKDAKASFIASYCALVLGNASNLVIPARGGDIVRIVVLGKLSGLSNSKSLATVITERIFDLMMLCLLIGCIALIVPLPESIELGAHIIAAISFSAIIGACGVIFLYSRHRDFVDKHIIRRFPKFLHHRLHELLQGLGQGMSLMLRSKAGILFIAYTLVIWVFEIGLLYILARSLSFTIDLLHSITLFLCAAVGTLIPLSTAQIGVFEFITVSTLEKFGYDPAKALALGIIWHGAILAFPILLGLFTWLSARPALKAAPVTSEEISPELPANTP